MQRESLVSSMEEREGSDSLESRLLTQSKEKVLHCREGCEERGSSVTGVGANKGFSGQVHDSARSARGNGATFN